MLGLVTPMVAGPGTLLGVWVHLELKGHHRVLSTVTPGETKAQRGKEASVGPRSCSSFPQHQSHK